MKKVLITMKVDTDMNGKGFVEIEKEFQKDNINMISHNPHLGFMEEIVDEEKTDLAILDMLDFWKHYYENERRKTDSLLYAINKEMKTRIG